MGLIRSLTAKPWLDNSVEEIGTWGTSSRSTVSLGLIVFLVVVGVLFSLLVSAYFIRMSYPDWKSLPEPSMLWPNTLILAASSVAFHWARIAAQYGRLADLKLGLLVSGGLAFGFLVGQLLAWQQLGDLGYYVATNPANTFFYLITALHAAHLLGGLFVWSWATAALWRSSNVSSVRTTVELSSTYWHFLFAVWLLLFALLLADNDGKISFLGFCRAVWPGN